MTSPKTSLDALYRERPKSHFLRVSLGIMASGMVLAFAYRARGFQAFFDGSRGPNFRLFCDRARPAPYRDGESGVAVLWDWMVEILRDGGIDAILGTLGISVAAIGLATLVGVPAAFLARRHGANREVDRGRKDGLRRWLLAAPLRFAFVLMRSLPEYLIAFVFVSFIIGSPWPGVLALAIHNAGILGRLVGEAIEDLNPAPLKALVGIGASPQQTDLFATLPLVTRKILVYIFYRWETCVREATVLGMLGFASLGFAIADARSRRRYDQLLFFVALGSMIVLIGDLASALVRRYLRNK